MQRKPAVCIVDACGRPANVPGTARGYCIKHYNRWRNAGRLACEVPGCAHPPTSTGWCRIHEPAGWIFA